jgi:hypothetical protein
MIHYNPDLERFVDGVDFGPNDPCTWIVYPVGCAGDLLSSIVNFHYVETGARFKGISDRGQVMFKGSDQKYTNKLWQANQLKFDEQYFYDLADILSSNSTHWSKMDCLLFSAHLYQDHHIQLILDTFKNCKIIRFLPKTHGDRSITEWLGEFKNPVSDVVPEFAIPDNHHMEITYTNTISDSRLLTVFFKDVINSAKFKSTYQLIQTHLGFPGPLITYDFIQFWIDQQPLQIRSFIESIARCD